MSLLLSTSRTGLVGGDPPTVPAAAARRLSAIQREAATLALAALHRAGTERPDAIIVSTALGCLDDTERFLADMHDANLPTGRQAPALLSPLPFMRSTHTTMAGQLALMLGCQGPNITHAQGMDGFHAALVEAELLLHEHPEWRVLVLAIDERTELLERVTGRLAPDVSVGAGGEAFVLTGGAEAPCIGRIRWQVEAADKDVSLVPSPVRPRHGALMAEQLGEAVERGLTVPLVIGTMDRSTALVVSPC